MLFGRGRLLCSVAAARRRLSSVETLYKVFDKKGGDANVPLIEVKAVSYTHLDVYKRQCHVLGTN